MKVSVQIVNALFVVLCSVGCQLVVNVEEGGLVESTSNVRDCDDIQCVFDIDDNYSSDTFIASAEAGYRFVGWEGNCSAIWEDQCRVTIPKEFATLSGQLEITAKFEPSPSVVQPLEPTMVTIPGGVYEMGCHATDDECSVYDYYLLDSFIPNFDYDLAVPRVTEVNTFLLSAYEITFAEYDRFVEESGSASPPDGGWGRGNRPALVGPSEIMAYITWLNQKTGKTYRLPTEEEWEYAARAGTTTKYHFGDSISCADANYLHDENGTISCASHPSDIVGRTAEVGSYPPNAFGLYDMHGNVSERTSNCIFIYDESTLDVLDEVLQVVSLDWIVCGERGTLRGGSWANYAEDVRSAARPGDAKLLPAEIQAQYFNSQTGFRLAMDIAP